MRKQTLENIREKAPDIWIKPSDRWLQGALKTAWNICRYLEEESGESEPKTSKVIGDVLGISNCSVQQIIQNLVKGGVPIKSKRKVGYWVGPCPGAKR